MLNEIVALVKEAGEMIRSAHQIERDTREKNGAADLVTKYDVAVQEFLKRGLLQLMPQADFFGEEGEKEKLTRDWCFIVDPIDGTTNFVREMNYSNIAVALAYRGQVRYGVVYNPFVGELFAAERGKGATMNGQPIHVSDKDVDHGIVLCGSTIYDRTLTRRNFAILEDLYDKALDYRRFGAAELDICQVAAGRAEMYYECRLSPWDYAAGSVIVEEAGGHLSQLDGSPVSLTERSSVWCTNDKCYPAWQGLPE